MVYKNNIPQPNDFLDESQVELLGNFSSADTSFGVNHYAFSNLTTNNGKHNFVEMPIRGSIPTNLANEGSVYTKTSGQTQLFYTSDAGANEYQMTTSVDANFSKFSTNTNFASNTTGGWTFLPGGLILNYGIATLLANPTTVTITFAQGYATANDVFSIVLGSISSNTSTTAQEVRIIPGTITATTFQLRQSSSSGANQVYWQAIGKA